MNSGVNRPSDKSILACVDAWIIYLTDKQLSISAHQKEILLATSSQSIQPTPCHCISSSTMPLVGLAGHLGHADCMPPAGRGPSLRPITAHSTPLTEILGADLLYLRVTGLSMHFFLFCSLVCNYYLIYFEFQ